MALPPRAGVMDDCFQVTENTGKKKKKEMDARARLKLMRCFFFFFFPNE